MNRAKVPVLLAAAVLLGVAVVGLVQRDPGGGGDGGGGAPTASAGSGTVAIVDFTYDPDVTEVAVGGTVSWTNQDGADHTVTSEEDGGPLDSESVEQDQTYAVTFDAAGTYEYTCKFHPNMHGTVDVSG